MYQSIGALAKGPSGNWRQPARVPQEQPAAQQMPRPQAPPQYVSPGTYRMPNGQLYHPPGGSMHGAMPPPQMPMQPTQQMPMQGIPRLPMNNPFQNVAGGISGVMQGQQLPPQIAQMLQNPQFYGAKLA